MRKTLPHKGIVLRSHACLEETQRNKQECFVWGGNRMNDHWGDMEVKWESRSRFLFDTVILGFLTILKNCQASSKFEAVNSKIGRAHV